MNSSINLLKRAQTPQSLKNRAKRILNIVSFFSLILFIAASLVLFFSNLYVSARLKDTSQKIRSLEIRLGSLSEVERRHLSISDKLAALEKIIKEERVFEDNLREFDEILPPGVVLSQVKLIEDSFAVSVTSPQLANFNQFIGNLISPELGGKFFTKIILEGLSVDDKGIYRMNVSGEIL